MNSEERRRIRMKRKTMQEMQEDEENNKVDMMARFG